MYNTPVIWSARIERLYNEYQRQNINVSTVSCVMVALYLHSGQGKPRRVDIEF
jgi:hypothetical protein